MLENPHLFTYQTILIQFTWGYRLKMNQFEQFLSVNKDSFSDGQIKSKLWLCEKLESNTELIKNDSLKVWVLGAWYGLLPFLILSRGRMKIQNLHLVDVDAEAVHISKKFLDHWVQKKFDIQFHHADFFSLELSHLNKPNLVINTSCEHFKDNSWLDKIPPGAMVALQSTNMQHPTHCNAPLDLSDFVKNVSQWVNIETADQIDFNYPSLKFSRYMLIGRRHELGNI